MRRFHFATTDSTNVQARRMAAQWPGEPLLVTAEVQTAGRGRQGRTWQSPRGGAWMSVVWPLRRPPGHYATASLAAAVAVHRGICREAPICDARLLIKWPNDLLLDDRKLAGILCECVPSSGSGGPGVLIIGVGVNVDFEAAQIAGPLRRAPTTLRTSLGSAPDVEQVIDSITDELGAALVAFDDDGLSPPRIAELRRRLACIGAVRTVASARGPVTGRVLGVDGAGRLLLDGPAGLVACDVGELLDSREVDSDGA